jgi:nucleoside-diphosphate-sugar epimerase
MNILVTGANGFVGSALCQEIASSTNWSIYGTMRSHQQTIALLPTVRPIIIDSLTSTNSYQKILSEIDCVVHLAARVHMMKDRATNPLAAFREINTYGTANLAKEAADRGVKRFIYISSIKVNGEESGNGCAYTEESLPNPQDPYGQSKLEAEQALDRIASETGMEVVILRPPLVYGPKVKANFLQLLRIVKKGVPLPLSSINNARSLLYVGNLVDAILTCLSHPNAAGQTFLLSDGEDLSTPELIRRLAKAMKQPDRLFPVPPSFLKKIGKLTGKSTTVERLLGSLTIDNSKIQQTLNWKPPFTVDRGLQATVDWYLNE